MGSLSGHRWKELQRPFNVPLFQLELWTTSDIRIEIYRKDAQRRTDQHVLIPKEQNRSIANDNRRVPATNIYIKINTSLLSDVTQKCNLKWVYSDFQLHTGHEAQSPE